jgi:ubiquinone/menaquinone biosynthesis C-methylase UbiE
MSEMTARDDQVDQYDANIPLMLFGAVEIPYTINLLDLSSGDSLLEAGCGTGRMSSRLASHVKELIAIDFSAKSLVENDVKLQAAGAKNVHLIQADICNLPLKSELFNKAVSCQVLEHVPTEELRQRAVEEITRSVKPGSTVVISAYQHSRWTKDKEGEHDGGIPYFRFTEEELSSLLQTTLDVQSISGLLVYIFLAKCMRPIPVPAQV